MSRVRIFLSASVALLLFTPFVYNACSSTTFDGKVPTLQEPSRDEGSSTGNPDTSELAFGAFYWNSGIEVKL
ncbi:MAG: hypothetical protein ABL958_04660, partial [Bdellovibrionia bacterium]